jgi:hypothetical protein|uniref:membrane or secreted protein n=1 Tax=Polaribacter sp. TaxID=1920175 RepID=UPI0040478727
MKNLKFVLYFLLGCVSSFAQGVVGAWETQSVSNTGEEIRGVLVFAEGYHVLTWYEASAGRFISAEGGLWKLETDMLTRLVEFDSKEPEKVGSEVSLHIKFSNEELELEGQAIKWKKIDDGFPGALAGAWVMSGRKTGDKIQSRDTNQPRKTMKILSGTRFQWIAYNTETKQFSGTGGGTYATIDGKYTETIEFFSKDNSRVGVSLGFDYSLKNADWHHSGLSSKGTPIYEVWSIRPKTDF